MSLTRPNNALLTIRPYKRNGLWVFDDPDVGLVKEPFVLGMPEIIEALLERAGYDVEQAEANGFNVIFSANELPGYEAKLVKDKNELGGAWYCVEVAGAEMKGWLCPALLCYFDEPPATIYVNI